MEMNNDEFPSSELPQIPEHQFSWNGDPFGQISFFFQINPLILFEPSLHSWGSSFNLWNLDSGNLWNPFVWFGNNSRILGISSWFLGILGSGKKARKSTQIKCNTFRPQKTPAWMKSKRTYTRLSCPSVLKRTTSPSSNKTCPSP